MYSIKDESLEILKCKPAKCYTRKGNISAPPPCYCHQKILGIWCTYDETDVRTIVSIPYSFELCQKK